MGKRKFTITPYIGALPIKFGMTPKDVKATIGAPHESRKLRSGKRSDSWGDVNVRYSKKPEKVVEISFSPEATVELDGVSLLDSPRALKTLLKRDPKPRETVGFLIFYEIGIMVSGLHDGDADQIAISVFGKGVADEFFDDSTPWKPLRR